MRAIGSPELFSIAFNVSRETIDRLIAYEKLLRKWNDKINLVAKSTLADIWHRHFADSAQLLRLARQKTGLWADFGSGAGFPGLVIAILAKETLPDLMVVLVESDTRKCAFLATVSRQLGLNVRIENARVEALANLGARTISARALAPLDELLPLARRHLADNGECLFLKGATVESELTAIDRIWNSSVETIPSVTDPSGVVLRIGDIQIA